jgi:hypothetical protein
LVGFLGTPRGLGRATATTSATFFPHCEHRIRVASCASVADLPAIRASASGSIWRDVPQGHVTRTGKLPKAIVELLEASRRTGAWCRYASMTVHAVRDNVSTCMAPTWRAIQMVATFSGVLGDLNADLNAV